MTIRRHLELHDSSVRMELTEEAVVLHLCPAYVHSWQQSEDGWQGVGSNQSAEIVISRGSITPSPEDRVHEIADGWLDVDGQLHRNLIPVALDAEGPTRGQLDLAGFPSLKIEGQGVVVRLLGEPTFVEVLPPEWSPDGSS